MNANKILPFVYPRPSVITPWAHTTASVHVVTSKKQIQTLSVKVLRKMSVSYIEFITIAIAVIIMLHHTKQ